MTNQGGLGGGSLSTISGTVAGVGGGALMLPETGSGLVVTALVIATAAAIAMLVSMGVSKLIRKAS